MIIISASSSECLAQKVASILGCKHIKAISLRFPDGECYIRVNTERLEDDIVIIQNTYPNDNLIEMLLLQDTVLRMGAKSLTIVVPYFGYARQDKIFKYGEQESAKVIAKHLMGCDRVITIDIHKESVLDYFDCPHEDLKAACVIADYFMDRNIDVVLSPDVGAADRAKDVGERMGIPFDHLDKIRFSGTCVKIAPTKIDCKGKRILIVDDLISTGSTIVAASQALKAAGAVSISVVCTHGVFIDNAIERLSCENIDTLVCCDTIRNRVSQISVADMIAESIKKRG